MARYAVATTLTKAVPTGINIQTRLMMVDAVSEDEARGLAVKDALEANPEFQIHAVVHLTLSPNGDWS